jgi:hypothetical protein
MPSLKRLSAILVAHVSTIEAMLWGEMGLLVLNGTDLSPLLDDPVLDFTRPTGSDHELESVPFGSVFISSKIRSFATLREDRVATEPPQTEASTHLNG